MPCNAFNHPSNCDCGWGGQGYGGARSGPTHSEQLIPFFATYWTPSRRNIYDSYVNPNAKCPVCGASVFFFQASNGGRVFFDELGPPWPKHPCTDMSSHHWTPREFILSARKPDSPIQWQDDGWEPVLLVDAKLFEFLTILKVRRIDSDGLELNIAIKTEAPLGRDALTFIRESDIGLGIFDVSYLDTVSGHMAVTPRQTLGMRNCYTFSEYEIWQQAIEGSSAHQNLVARMILFSNEETQAEFVNCDDLNIDFAAARFWLSRAIQNNHDVAKKNIEQLDIQFLKAKLQGDRAFKREDFIEE